MRGIAGRPLGAGHPCLVVAELGTSHLGDLDRGKALVDAAGAAGADCVKLQLVYAQEILHPLSGIVELPTGRVELYRHFESLERDIGFYAALKRHAEACGLTFLCSAFGIRSARELRGLGVTAMKIASPELNHFPLLREVSGYGIPLVLSTGVSRLSDIERALEITGRETVLLHCVTSYPAPEEEYNLRVLSSLGCVFGVPMGVSDHSLDPVLVPVLSAVNGACVIEKHFALSRTGSGLDDPIALEPHAFLRMVKAVREAERSGPLAARREMEKAYGAERVRLVEGSGVKELAPSERHNYSRTNRSIHAVAEIPAAALIGEDMVAVLRTEKVLRPGIGPEFLPRVIGARARRLIPAGEGVLWEDILH
jgi:sialic acid synthase SpsE